MPLLTEKKAVNDTEYCCTTRYTSIRNIKNCLAVQGRRFGPSCYSSERKKKYPPKQILIAKAKKKKKKLKWKDYKYKLKGKRECLSIRTSATNDMKVSERPWP